MTLVDRLRDRFGVEPILRVLGVSVSTFYGWLARRRHPSPRDIEETWLGEQIERIHRESGETCGSPKVHAQLRREGIRVSRKRVERLMREAGPQGAFMRKRRRSSTRRDPTATPAPDLVNRQFTTPGPNRLWVADISRIPTGEGPLWLASVRDAFSRRVVGWKASDRADTQLVLGRWSMPCGAARSSASGWCSIPTTAPRADSTGRCNTPTVREWCCGEAKVACGRSSAASWDAVTWTAPGQRAGGPAAVLAQDRRGILQPGRCHRMRRVSPGGDAVVP